MNSKPIQKKYTLDEKQVRRVKRILKAKTEQEAIYQALEMIIANEKIDLSHEAFVRSEGVLEDTLGRLP